MELNLARQNITINETVFGASVEQPIECDALLPDYCPDIVKVLKCAAVTHLDSSTVSGNRLTIEGMAIVHIYYATEQHQIRHVEYKIPFAKQVELHTPVNQPVVSVTPSVDYVNCRAVNQRRIDVRGALSFAVKIIDQKEQQFISDASGAGLQLRREVVKATDILGQSRSVFSVTEDLEIGYGKSQVGTVVRVDHRIRAFEHKVISGKVVTKGEMILHILYQPLAEEENLEVMEYALPISQIVDSEHADEDCICDVEMFVVSCDLAPKAGEDGEYRAFSLDARVGVNITAHKHSEIPVAGDCYSTQFETATKRAPVTFIRLVEMVNESISHKVTLDLPEGVERILDAWTDIDTMTWRQEAGAVMLDLRMSVCLFARMENRECFYFEHPTELSYTIPISHDCVEFQFEPTADLISSSFNLVGKDKIDIRCEVVVRGCVYCTVKSEAILEIAVDEEKLKVKEQNRLYIYYADAGERVWDIAKRYNTAGTAIWEENNIEDDLLPEKRMLLIPIV
ncbi:MAG: DUF3794 domain-containing protein [Oscillospiraceae bacterium]|nr:DUF3794 domain-containing protein [Oscillospiraceae bacterium]